MARMLYRSIVIISLVGLLSGVARGQELTPRAYWPAPLGTRIASVGYSYTSGDTIPDRSLPLTGVNSSINTLHLGYRHTVSLWGRTTNLVVELPYSDGRTTGSRDNGTGPKSEYQGAGDIAATISVNFMGAPTMSPKEFAEMRRNPRPLLAGSLKVVAPTGKYDSERLINVGANRWAVRAELGYVAPLSPKWLLELGLGGWFFGDNDQFLGRTKKQDPIAAIQGHLIHRFDRGFWASLDMNYYKGGRSTVGSFRLDDLQRDSKVGVTIVYPLGGKHAVKLGYSLGSLNDSGEKFEVFQIGYQRIL
jgi:hypothetical protein